MSERSDWPIIVGRFRCGAEVRPGDVLGPVQINWVFGRPDRFGLTFRYLDGSGGGSSMDDHEFSRDEWIKRRGLGAPYEPDEWWD